MKSYTLDQLAWFNRCLVPDDFASAMCKVGYGYFDSKFLQSDLRNWQRNNRRLNVVDIYQEYIEDDYFIECLNRVLSDFFIKNEVAK